MKKEKGTFETYFWLCSCIVKHLNYSNNELIKTPDQQTTIQLNVDVG